MLAPLLYLALRRLIALVFLREGCQSPVPSRHCEVVLVQKSAESIPFHTYVEHYNRQRPRRTLALAARDPLDKPIPLGKHSPARVHRRDRLDGLLHEYQRAA